ncbi:MAG: hypothetical protein Q9P44_21965 [Anaerolineae bacterium]|nr:hypothetical protein [Anaerolineae bacterium]
MQRSLRSAIPELGTDNYKFISLVVDTNVTDADVVNYANTQGFDWTFTVAAPEFLTAFVNQFGRTVVTIGSMGHFVLRPDGSQSEFFLGTPPPAQLIQEIRSVSSQ